MSPIEWAVRPLRSYAAFSGRAPRAEYWWYVLAITIIGGVLGFLDGLALHGHFYGSLGPLGLVFRAATVVPGIAVLVRRLHDTERSGWWALVRAPSYGLIIAGSKFTWARTVLETLSGAFFVSALIAMIAWLFLELFIFLCMVSEGTEGSNRYGPDPYGPDALEEVFA